MWKAAMGCAAGRGATALRKAARKTTALTMLGEGKLQGAIWLHYASTTITSRLTAVLFISWIRTLGTLCGCLMMGAGNMTSPKDR